MTFSIIIPAHNEEQFIGRCLESIHKAIKHGNHKAEIIVVANRCSDHTAEIALKHGAKVILNDDRNLAKIRNAGAAAANNDVIITIDADSWMTDNTLSTVQQKLQTGKYIGGGVTIRAERYSVGIVATLILLHAGLFLTGLCGGMYWCYRKDFNAIGGFNEELLVAEDLDLAKRLRAYGKTKGLRLHKITKAKLYTSCRKFDTFGDWVIFRTLLTNPKLIYQTFKGTSDTLANRFFYDYKH